MTTPSDLIGWYYNLLQKFTTSRPGPTFNLILERAGVEQVEPPSKNSVNALLKNEKSVMKLLENVSSNSSNIVQRGGANAKRLAQWIACIFLLTLGYFLTEKVKNAVGMTHQVREVPLSTADFQQYEQWQQALPLLSRSGEFGDPMVSIVESRASTEISKFVKLFLGLASLAFFTDVYSGLFGDGDNGGYGNGDYSGGGSNMMIPKDVDMGNILQTANKYLETIVSEIDGAGDPTRFSILDIPSSGTLNLKQTNNNGKVLIDPILFRNLETGDKVAVINNKIDKPILLLSLQAWIYFPLREGVPTNPITNEEFKKEDIKVYTLNLTGTNLTVGGRKKNRKTRKSKKTRKGSRKH